MRPKSLRYLQGQVRPARHAQVDLLYGLFSELGGIDTLGQQECNGALLHSSAAEDCSLRAH